MMKQITSKTVKHLTIGVYVSADIDNCTTDGEVVGIERGGVIRVRWENGIVTDTSPADAVARGWFLLSGPSRDTARSRDRDFLRDLRYRGK
jgi:hypothetical protein